MSHVFSGLARPRPRCAWRRAWHRTSLTRRLRAHIPLCRVTTADCVCVRRAVCRNTDSRESAALVMANASQLDDAVCARILALPDDLLAALVARLQCECARLCVLRQLLRAHPTGLTRCTPRCAGWVARAATKVIVKKSVARTVANCTAAELDEGAPDAAEVLRKAGVVPALLDVIPTRDLPRASPHSRKPAALE